jgi:hypothetical protein
MSLILKDGIYLNLSNKVYHEELSSDYVSSSFLKTFKQSPRLVWLQKTNSILKKEKTPSMEFGELVHELILEPDKFKDREFLAEGETRRAKENKDKIPYKTYEQLKIINEIFNLPEHESQKRIIDSSLKEITIISNGKKARLDYIAFAKNQTILGDIKTHSVEDVNGIDGISLKMKYHINDYDYLLQLCFYKMIFLEIIERINNGEDIVNETGYNFKEVSTNINCQMLTVYNQAPFDIITITIGASYIYAQIDEIIKLLHEIESQKSKHDGFSRMWDSNQSLTLEYSD